MEVNDGVDGSLPPVVDSRQLEDDLDSLRMLFTWLIGITIIAIGTSLPELITSVIAIRKGHTDIGIGTIVGSNIYNILMILGISSVITGIAVVPGMFTDYLVMIGFAVVLVAFLRSGIIPRPAGIGLAIAYAAYLGYTLLL